MDAIAELEQELLDRRTRSTRLFWEVAKKIASAEKPNLDEVEGAIAGSGETIESLRIAVARIQKRLALTDQIAATPSIVKERGALQKQITDAGDELRRADKKCGQITFPAQVRLNEIDAAEQAAHIGKIALVEQCPYAWLVEDRRRLQSEIADRERELSDFQGHVQGQKLGQELTDARKAAEEQHIAPEVASARKATLKGVQNRHDVATRHREQLGNEIADLRKALVRLESEMLRP